MTDADREDSGSGTRLPELLERTDPNVAVYDLPPSAKLVALVLLRHPESSTAEIADRSLLPERTVRYALTQLEEQDLIEASFSVTDTRIRLYSLALPSD